MGVHERGVLQGVAPTASSDAVSSARSALANESWSVMTLSFVVIFSRLATFSIVISLLVVDGLEVMFWS